MRIKVDLTKLTRRQREVLTALARRLSKNEIERLVEATTRSGGVIGEAVKQAVDRAKAAIEELERRHAAKSWQTASCLPHIG
ncbi:MAG: hypothetical protein WB822_11760 [Rhodoplanes sp.]